MQPEVCAGKDMVDNDDEPRADTFIGPDTLTVGSSIAFCGCLFFSKWQLPCRHIFFSYFRDEGLPEDLWPRFVNMWEEAGFELYFEIDRASVQAQELKESEIPVAERGAARALEERLRAHSFDAEDYSKIVLGREDSRRYLQWRIDLAEQGLSSILNEQATVQNWQAAVGQAPAPRVDSMAIRPMQPF